MASTLWTVVSAILAVSIVLSGVGVFRRSWWLLAGASILSMLAGVAVFMPQAALLALVQLTLAVGFRWGLGPKGWAALPVGVAAVVAGSWSTGAEWGALAFAGLVITSAVALVLGEPDFRSRPVGLPAQER